jgi:hypothetical protein
MPCADADRVEQRWRPLPPWDPLRTRDAERARLGGQDEHLDFGRLIEAQDRMLSQARQYAFAIPPTCSLSVQLIA